MTNQIVTKSYSKMVELAEAISPKAKVRKKSDEDVWEIYIPTDFHIDPNLSEEYKGTAAWDASNEYDYSYGGSELDRWAENRNYEDYPIDAVAEFYNHAMTVAKKAHELLMEFQKETGIYPENRENLTKAQVTMWLNKNRDVELEANEIFADTRAALDKKWGDL